MAKRSQHRKVNRACNMLRCSNRKLFELGYRLRHGKVDRRTVDRAYGRYHTNGRLANFVRRLVSNERNLEKAKELLAQST